MTKILYVNIGIFLLSWVGLSSLKINHTVREEYQAQYEQFISKIHTISAWVDTTSVNDSVFLHENPVFRFESDEFNSAYMLYVDPLINPQSIRHPEEHAFPWDSCYCFHLPKSVLYPLKENYNSELKIYGRWHLYPTQSGHLLEKNLEKIFRLKYVFVLKADSCGIDPQPESYWSHWNPEWRYFWKARLYALDITKEKVLGVLPVSFTIDLTAKKHELTKYDAEKMLRKKILVRHKKMLEEKFSTDLTEPLSPEQIFRGKY